MECGRRKMHVAGGNGVEGFVTSLPLDWYLSVEVVVCTGDYTAAISKMKRNFR